MSFEEMLVAVVGTVAVFGLLGYVSAKTFGLIKAWINRKQGGVPEEEFNRLAKAFMQYKKDTERRLRHLETIASEKDEERSSDKKFSSKQVEAPRQNIEIENQQKEKDQSQTEDSNNLRNMLRE